MIAAALGALLLRLCRKIALPFFVAVVSNGESMSQVLAYRPSPIFAFFFAMMMLFGWPFVGVGFERDKPLLEMFGTALISVGMFGFLYVIFENFF